MVSVDPDTLVTISPDQESRTHDHDITPPESVVPENMTIVPDEESSNQEAVSLLPEEVVPVDDVSDITPFWIWIDRERERVTSVLFVIVKITSVIPEPKITVFGLHFPDSTGSIPAI
jgi:hypothetical protein